MNPKDTENLSYMEEALLIAKEITEGRRNPNLGCDQIAALSTQNNSPKELTDFEHLSHLQAGHESMGFNKENLREGIFEESRKLLKLKTEPAGRGNG